MSNTDPQRDSTIIKGPTDALDHAQSVATLGTHMGFDATRKLPTEGYTRAWPELLKMDPAVQARVDALLARAASSAA
jgi:4-hydroxy-3-polyprenylbenzoate decarboxylase